jgi:hypothetical protein
LTVTAARISNSPPSSASVAHAFDPVSGADEGLDRDVIRDIRPGVGSAEHAFKQHPVCILHLSVVPDCAAADVARWEPGDQAQAFGSRNHPARRYPMAWRHASVTIDADQIVNALRQPQHLRSTATMPPGRHDKLQRPDQVGGGLQPKAALLD